MIKEESAFLFSARIHKQSSDQERGHSPSSEVSVNHKRKKKMKRKKKSDDYIALSVFNIPGVTKIAISPVIQEIIKCSVGKQITAEYSWKYVPKEVIDSVYSLDENSEFLPIKADILNYPKEELLLGYIPDESTDYDTFYICLTETAEKAVSEIINKAQKDREYKLHNAIWKTAKPWKNLGSDVEVDLTLQLNNRSLLEVELESKYPVISTKCRFKLNHAKCDKNSYTELLCHKSRFNNVYKKKINSSTQVTPVMKSSMAQTFYTYPINAWTQYEYEYQVEELNPELEENIELLLKSRMDNLNNVLDMNSLINFYTNDYQDLISDDRSTRIPEAVIARPFATLLDETFVNLKKIVSLSWHPAMKTLVAIAYTEDTQNNTQKDPINEETYRVAFVTLWDIKDPLKPKLYLETTREVLTISFCPVDANILVGGCKSGQIVIWNIEEKLKKIAKKEITTVSRDYIYSLISWTRKEVDIVRHTLTSDLKFSHNDNVTAISWLSPFKKISKLGKIKEICNYQRETSLQFMSASTDGKVIFWDLSTTPDIKTNDLEKLPITLKFNKSRVNKILRPIYIIEIKDETLKQAFPLLTLDTVFTKTEQQQISFAPSREFSIPERILQTSKYDESEESIASKLIAGTSHGDIVIAEWKGFQFDDEEDDLLKELCQIESVATYHDGPVVSVSKSTLHDGLYLTVGGKIFALWDFRIKNRPIFWKRGKCKYTQGVWNVYKPSMFRLTRYDGYVEIWDLKRRSDKCVDLKKLSNHSITGTYTSSLDEDSKITGVADSNGAFRLYFINHEISDNYDEDSLYIKNFCEREVQRKIHFQNWQSKWNEEHHDLVKKKKEAQLVVEKERVEKEKLKEITLRKDVQKRTRKSLQPPLERWKRPEWMQQQWINNEKERLTKQILMQKHINLEMLYQMRLPLTNLSEDENKKKLKQKERLENAEKVFNQTVTKEFPKLTKTISVISSNGYAGKVTSEKKLECFKQFQNIQNECQEFINNHPYEATFNWTNFLKEGRKRRTTLNRIYSRATQRTGIIKEKEGHIQTLKVEERLEEEKTKTVL